MIMIFLVQAILTVGYIKLQWDFKGSKSGDNEKKKVSISKGQFCILCYG